MQVESRILKLDNHLINQIAAGEVVENPASALKEIIENSIDAQCTHLSIDLESGGKTLIRVADNGKGLMENDLPLVFERHATSKIQSLQDLENNFNLGFRGEALAAISSVSQIEFATRHHNSLHGSSIDANGQITSKAMNIGTTVTIKDLFFNTVARQKYLKTDSTEYKKCLQIITSYMLAHPQIGFRVTHNSKLIYKLEPQDVLDRIAAIKGDNFASQLVKINYLDEQIKLTGFICKPQAAVAKMPVQQIFVNKRPINAKNFNHAILQSYGSWLFSPNKPQFILYFDIDPKTVDMNIHPRKLEAKFFLESKIYGVLRQVVKKTLESHSLTPSVAKSESLAKFVPGFAAETQNTHQGPSQTSSQARPSFGGLHSYGLVSNPSQKSYSNSSPRSHVESQVSSVPDYPQATSAFHAEQSFENHELIENPNAEKDLKAICQIKNSYIIAEGQDDIFIVDQHAAHERVWYEILKNNANSKQPQSQPLLVSETFELDLSHLETLKKCKQTLSKLGFDFVINQNQLTVKAVPTKLNKISIQELFINILEDIEQNHEFSNLNELEDIVINFTACRTAIKFGQSLQLSEMQQLLDDMQLISHRKYTCPHGRPAMIKLGMRDLEKLFKRIH
jgi:DNA mismatch repair protein MutL